MIAPISSHLSPLWLTSSTLMTHVIEGEVGKVWMGLLHNRSLYLPQPLTCSPGSQLPSKKEEAAAVAGKRLI